VASGFGETVTSVAGGYYATYALLSDGSVRAAGNNSYGEVGDGTNEQRTSPVAVPLAERATAVSAGFEFGLALLSGGRVAAWGHGVDGELGDGTDTEHTSPIIVPLLEHVVSIAAGCYFGLALRSDGTVAAWGYGHNGELGDGKALERPSPIVIPGLEHVVAIAAGCYDSYALLASGEVKAWGRSPEGEVGDGTKEQKDSPVTIFPAGSNVTALSAGYTSALVLHADGTLSGWGLNVDGELGDGGKAEHVSPEALTKWPGPITGISSEAVATIASRAEGTAYGAGYNGYGELGDGTRELRQSPVPVSALRGVLAFGRGVYNFDFLAIQGASASLSGSSLAFGSQQVGTTSATQSVTLTNNGPAPLSVSGESLSGSPTFAKSSDGCSGAVVAPGASCSVALTFAPTAAVAAGATLAFSSSAVNALPTVALTGTGANPPAPPHKAPQLGPLSLSHSAFRAARSGPTALSAAATGTLVSYTDSEPATANFLVQRALKGVSRGSGKSRHCGARSKHAKRHAKPCTYYRTVGRFGHSDVAGANRVRFSGRVHGRKLTPGAYRLLATASAFALNSAPRAKAFRIVR
jgi:hypothetical protein